MQATVDGGGQATCCRARRPKAGPVRLVARGSGRGTSPLKHGLSVPVPPAGTAGTAGLLLGRPTAAGRFLWAARRLLVERARALGGRRVSMSTMTPSEPTARPPRAHRRPQSGSVRGLSWREGLGMGFVCTPAPARLLAAASDGPRVAPRGFDDAPLFTFWQLAAERQQGPSPARLAQLLAAAAACCHCCHSAAGRGSAAAARLAQRKKKASLTLPAACCHGSLLLLLELLLLHHHTPLY
ncbi:hypothetical protein BS50DRAFT_668815 [Corynespora cassiicola Philippines]|uniref:Uncharacterized protein n=1 Tax=Corynespora cassiicola Philippines TaxID=1448308 RepID=A0A2T2NL23_CORCC|nr:hypothetical protein BS50DRAFT_668815 [Corynespora cassiicola Philippines]